MKSIFLIMFCLSISLSFYPQKLEDPIIPNEKSIFITLKDKQVKKRIERAYFLDDKGNNISDKEELIILELDSLRPYYLETVYQMKDTFVNKFVFNKHNDLIKFSEQKSGVRQKGRFKYDYDSVGNIVREFKTDGSSKVMSFKEHSRVDNEMNTSIYDEKSQLLVKERMVYDPVNKIYSIQSISSEKKIEFQEKIFLNNAGQVIKYELRQYSKDLITKKVYQYDDKGNMTETILTDEEGKPLNKIVSKYNDKGLEIRRTLYEPFDKIKKISKFEYEYFEMSEE